MFNTRPPKPEHIKAFLKCLKKAEVVTPHEIAKRSGLSLTAVQGVIAMLANENRIGQVRQVKSPRLQIWVK